MEVREASAKYLPLEAEGCPVGYKQTEVGVIPEDWEVIPLGKCLRRPPSYGINAPAIPYDSRYPTYLRITDITEDGRFSEVTKVSVNHPTSLMYLLEPGDIVLARTGASVGKSYLYNSNDGELVFAGFLIRIAPDFDCLAPDFLSFFLQSSTYWSWVKVSSMRSGQPGINGREYASLLVPVPPTKAEQEAIASALSDADALIDSLSQLLAKKRQIKQGAMQELLTGKRRLLGFSGEWEVKRLGDLCSMKSGYGITSEHIDEFSVFPCYGGNGLRGYTQRYTHDGNYVLVGRQGALCGNVVSVDGKFFASEHAIVVTPFKESDIRWLSRILARMNLNQYSESSAQPGLSVAKLLELECPVPSVQEQTAIATILSDMDAEIAALENKLAKARQLKQGMMQELLTGRIRLV